MLDSKEISQRALLWQMVTHKPILRQAPVQVDDCPEFRNRFEILILPTLDLCFDLLPIISGNNTIMPQ
jgi:hypothetical protein